MCGEKGVHGTSDSCRIHVVDSILGDRPPSLVLMKTKKKSSMKFPHKYPLSQ